MEEKRLSVSMCIYGRDNPGHFDAAMASITEQTAKPDEIVLTVDGPVPQRIEDVINKYDGLLKGTETAFNVIRLEKNMGHGIARGICLKQCSCPLVAIMDADDLSLPERFKKQLAYFDENPDVSVVGGNISEFVSGDTPTDVSACVGHRIVPEKDADIKKYMQKRCPMNQVTVMFKKDDVDSVGGYIDWYCEEDYYLWTRLALAGKKFGNIPETLVNVRVGEEMYQRRGGIKYFKSEEGLQRFMLKKGLIGLPRYIVNVAERLVIQVLMPNKVRSWVFCKLIRS